MIHLKTCTIRCLITNAIFHAYRIRWFLKQLWVIMSTGMGYISKYRIHTTEIGTASPKITQQNINFPLSNLRSPLFALRSHTQIPLSGAKEKWSKLLMKTWWSIARQWEVYNRSGHGKQFHELHTRKHVNFCNWWPNCYGITTTFDDECVLPCHCCSEHPLYTSHSLLSSWCLQIEVICKS
jgi:hypothetical protein